MNERLVGLADLARKHFPKTETSGEFWIFDEQKFAELIIQECVQVCNKIYFANYPDAEDFERSEEGDAIKKHFGITE